MRNKCQNLKIMLLTNAYINFTEVLWTRTCGICIAKDLKFACVNHPLNIISDSSIAHPKFGKGGINQPFYGGNSPLQEAVHLEQIVSCCSSS